MDWTSAPSIEVAPPEPAWRPFSASRVFAAFPAIERFLERERAQLAIWWVVAFGAGIAAWFLLPGRQAWIGFGLVALGAAVAGALTSGRLGRAVGWGGAALALGLLLAWARSASVAAPILDRPGVFAFEGKVAAMDERVADKTVRLTLDASDPALPPRVRVTFKAVDAAGIVEGSRLALRARLQPPPPMGFPGTHDFARDAWFAGIGAVGKGLGRPQLLSAGEPPPLSALRRSLGGLITERIAGPSAGIAVALVTGAQSAVEEGDAEAMRRSGLTHLLSVSGLHIAAVVGAAILLSLRLLALSERLALRFNLILVSAAIGAAAGIGYTLLTGMQVPTVRSCLAALLVLLGLALGRDALSLRLVAVGALAVMLFRPESVVGVSFQLSFTAAAAIVVFHSSAFARRHLSRRHEAVPARLLRSLAGLLATGLVVEAALIPLTLYHFHRAGLYGVAANLFAIPWTTFVVMPLEALALLVEPTGLAGPLWAATGWAIGRLLAVAHLVSSSAGAVATLAPMPRIALGLMVGGGMWLLVWTTRPRWWGLVPLSIGALLATTTRPPDLLVSGDGRHVAIVTPGGQPLLLRERTGDFTRDQVAEISAFDGETGDWRSLDGARCSRDACLVDVERGGKAWRLLAIRSRDRIAWEALTNACAAADVVVADRRLPRGCVPRWLKLDRAALEKSGGLAIRFDERPVIDSVASRIGGHPWAGLAPPEPLP